ncbi:CRISPR-associated protein Csx16 [Rhizobium sp. SG2393]|uniref:CRISPR-associated protein Csx16 n=1 Tax=Rhizobium sp. SG2393 TaxID=3276279 RepID=UPI0036733730
MTEYFISRHPGAVDWARNLGITAHHLRHLDPAIITSGDVVMGTLPIHLAATVCAAGAQFLFLALDLPEDLRDGRELSADELRRAHARLEEYVVKRVGNVDEG